MSLMHLPCVRNQTKCQVRFLANILWTSNKFIISLHVMQIHTCYMHATMASRFFSSSFLLELFWSQSQNSKFNYLVELRSENIIYIQRVIIAIYFIFSIYFSVHKKGTSIGEWEGRACHKVKRGNQMVERFDMFIKTKKKILFKNLS